MHAGRRPRASAASRSARRRPTPFGGIGQRRRSATARRPPRPARRCGGAGSARSRGRRAPRSARACCRARTAAGWSASARARRVRARRSMSDSSARGGGFGAVMSTRGCTNTNRALLALLAAARAAALRAPAGRCRRHRLHERQLRRTSSTRMTASRWTMIDSRTPSRGEIGRGRRRRVRPVVLEVEVHQGVTEIITGRQVRLEVPASGSGRVERSASSRQPLSDVQIDDAEGQRDGPDAAKTRAVAAFARTQRAAETRRPRPAGRSTRSWCFEIEPADERQQVAEIPAIQRADAGNARLAELENRQAAARPQDAARSRRSARAGSATLRMPKRDRRGVARRVGDRHARRVAAHQADRGRRAARRAASRSPSRSIAPAKSTPTTARARRAPHGRDRQVGGAGAQIEHALAGRQRAARRPRASRQRRSSPALST